MKNIRDFDYRDKTVLLRADFNVPLKDGKVQNADRIEKTLPTIKFLMDSGAKVVAISHLGRPKNGYEKSFSLEPVADKLSELLDKKVEFLSDPKVVSEDVIKKVKELPQGSLILLDNLRFNPEEKKNGENFSKELAELGDIFINDAFGTAHRAHSSNVGVTKYLPSAPGFLVQKELDFFGRALKDPKRPFVAILGGAKVSDKITVIENLMQKVDKIAIVGAMAFTFLKAQGISVGKSLVEDDKLDMAKELIKKAEEKNVELLLPVDFLAAKSIDDKNYKEVSIEEIPEDLMGLDIGPKSIDAIRGLLKDAKTIVWNGPAGVFEVDEYSKGTTEIAKIIASSDALSIIGGGDSASAVEKSGVYDQIDHISTGGGASLELLEGKELPAVKALEEN